MQLPNGQTIPDSFDVADLVERINQSGSFDSGFTNTPTGLYELQNAQKYFPSTNWTSLNQNNWAFGKDPQTGKWSLLAKYGDKAGMRIPLNEQDGKLIPDASAAKPEYWNTNPDNSWLPAMAAMYLGANYLPGLLGAPETAATGATQGILDAGTSFGGLDTSLGSGLYGMTGSMTPGAIDAGLLNSAGLSTLSGGIGGASTVGGGLAAGGAGALTGSGSELFGNVGSAIGGAAGGAAEGAAASTAASAASKAGILKSIADATGISEDILKLAIPGLAGVLSYFDTKNQTADYNKTHYFPELQNATVAKTQNMLNYEWPKYQMTPFSGSPYGRT